MKPFLNISIFFCIMLAAVGGTTAGKPEVKSAKILIHITGFDHTDGVAKVALVNSKANYESDGEPYMGFNYKIIDNEVVQTIVAPYGEYAVKVFHDENGNDKMDTRFSAFQRNDTAFPITPEEHSAPRTMKTQASLSMHLEKSL